MIDASRQRVMVALLATMAACAPGWGWTQPVPAPPGGAAEEKTVIRFGLIEFALPGLWSQTEALNGLVLVVAPAGRQDFAVWVYRDAPLGGMSLEDHLNRIRAPFERGCTVDPEASMAAPQVWTTDGGVQAAAQFRITRRGEGPKTYQSYLAFDRGDRAQVVVINAANEDAEKTFSRTAGVALRDVKPVGPR